MLAHIVCSPVPFHPSHPETERAQIVLLCWRTEYLYIESHRHREYYARVRAELRSRTRGSGEAPLSILNDINVL